MGERTWLCCHNCRWIESATYVESQKVNADGFCLTCGEPAADPFDKDFPYDPSPPMTKDKALEAALDAYWDADPGPTDTSYREAMQAAISAYLSALTGEAYADLLNRQIQTDPDIVAATAKNRSSLYSALPGEAEVAGYLVMHPDEGKDFQWVPLKPADKQYGFSEIPLVTLASLQSLQARAEKAERELSDWKNGHAAAIRSLGDQP